MVCQQNHGLTKQGNHGKILSDLESDHDDFRFHPLWKEVQRITDNGRQLWQSDEDWQKHFETLRGSVTPAKCGSPLIALNCDPTYRTFICDVLDVLHNGNVDYCFYDYQIEDLLKFEPKRLRTKWVPKSRNFMVWLSAPIT